MTYPEFSLEENAAMAVDNCIGALASAIRTYNTVLGGAGSGVRDQWILDAIRKRLTDYAAIQPGYGNIGFHQYAVDHLEKTRAA